MTCAARHSQVLSPALARPMAGMAGSLGHKTRPKPTVNICLASYLLCRMARVALLLAGRLLAMSVASHAVSRCLKGLMPLTASAESCSIASKQLLQHLSLSPAPGPWPCHSILTHSRSPPCPRAGPASDCTDCTHYTHCALPGGEREGRRWAQRASAGLDSTSPALHCPCHA